MDHLLETDSIIISERSLDVATSRNDGGDGQDNGTDGNDV